MLLAYYIVINNSRVPQGDQWLLKPWKPAGGGGGGDVCVCVWCVCVCGGGGHAKIPDPYMVGGW